MGEWVSERENIKYNRRHKKPVVFKMLEHGEVKVKEKFQLLENDRLNTWSRSYAICWPCLVTSSS